MEFIHTKVNEYLEIHNRTPNIQNNGRERERDRYVDVIKNTYHDNNYYIPHSHMLLV